MSTTRAVPLLLVQADLRCATKIKRALRELGAADGLVHVPSAAAALTTADSAFPSGHTLPQTCLFRKTAKNCDVRHNINRSHGTITTPPHFLRYNAMAAWTRRRITTRILLD